MDVMCAYGVGLRVHNRLSECACHSVCLGFRVQGLRFRLFRVRVEGLDLE